MKPRLYLETAIPSYLVARPSRDVRIAADQAVTVQWWELHRDDFEMFVSAAVIREVTRGGAEIAALRIARINRLPVLAPTPAFESLTERLLLDHIVPAVAADDAAHIGVAEDQLQPKLPADITASYPPPNNSPTPWKGEMGRMKDEL